MSASGAISSTINLLHPEYLRSVESIYNNTYPDDDSIQIQEPASWLCQLAHQHRLAQNNLQRFQQICEEELDGINHSIQTIERNYKILFQGV